MRITAHSEPGSPDSANEDWFSSAPGLVVVLDGATARTETGCVHGTAWYATRLGSAIVTHATDRARALPDVLADAIRDVAAEHPGCDLTHPGTPSAAVAIVRTNGEFLEYLVLADITVVFDLGDEIRIVVDDRINECAAEARRFVDEHPIGSPEKTTALIRMKTAELAVRNRPEGYWIAAATPETAAHALTGTVPIEQLTRWAVLTDGAARIVSLFETLTWQELLDQLAQRGPVAVLDDMRTLEAQDPNAEQWPRNKASDDATVVFASR